MATLTQQIIERMIEESKDPEFEVPADILEEADHAVFEYKYLEHNENAPVMAGFDFASMFQNQLMPMMGMGDMNPASNQNASNQNASNQGVPNPAQPLQEGVPTAQDPLLEQDPERLAQFLLFDEESGTGIY